MTVHHLDGRANFILIEKTASVVWLVLEYMTSARSEKKILFIGRSNANRF